jgi:hypothetical protein
MITFLQISRPQKSHRHIVIFKPELLKFIGFVESWSGIASTGRRHAASRALTHRGSGEKRAGLFLGQVGRSEGPKTENKIMNSQDSLWLLGAQ